MGPNLKTAIIYARVSTKRQADDGLPIASQIDRCEGKVKQLDARLIKTFVDGGISGRVDDRPEFQSAIDYCNAKKVDFFVTWSTSRFARNQIDAILYKQMLSKAGTKIIYVSIDIDRDSDSGFLTEGLMEILDEYQSRQIAKDTSRSMIRNAEQGHWNGGTPAFGYKPVAAEDNPKRKRLVINEAEACVVREIFKYRLNGFGCKAIAEALNNQGARSRKGKWAKHSVGLILRSYAVIGCQVHNRKNNKTKAIRPRDEWVVVDSHERIIDKHIWNDVQKIMDGLTNNVGMTRSNWFFSGLLICGHCGGRMQIQTGKGGRYSYYCCQKYVKNNSCVKRRMAAGDLDHFLVDVIGDEIFTTENLTALANDIREHAGTWAVDYKARRGSINDKIKKIDIADEKIMETIEMLGPKAGNVEFLLKRLRDNEERKIDFENEMRGLEGEEPPQINLTKNDIKRLSRFLIRLIKETTDHQKIKAFFSGFIDKIIVEDSRVILRYKPELLITVKGLEEVVPSKAIWLPGRSLLGTISIRVALPAKLRRVA